MRVGQWPVGVVQLAPSAGNRSLRVREGVGRTCQQNSGAWEGNRRMLGHVQRQEGGRQGLWKGSEKRGLCSPFWTDWWKGKCYLQHILEEFLPMAMTLQWFMDVKVQDAKWFYFIVSLAIILRGKKQQIPFRSKSLLSPPTLQHLCFQESKYLKLSASNNTHQYKEFLVSNFEEANNGSFSSPIGWGIRNKYQLSEKGRVKKRERGGGGGRKGLRTGQKSIWHSRSSWSVFEHIHNMAVTLHPWCTGDGCRKMLGLPGRWRQTFCKSLPKDPGLPYPVSPGRPPLYSI